MRIQRILAAALVSVFALGIAGSFTGADAALRKKVIKKVVVTKRVVKHHRVKKGK